MGSWCVKCVGEWTRCRTSSLRFLTADTQPSVTMVAETLFSRLSCDAGSAFLIVWWCWVIESTTGQLDLRVHVASESIICVNFEVFWISVRNGVDVRAGTWVRVEGGLAQYSWGDLEDLDKQNLEQFQTASHHHYQNNHYHHPGLLHHRPRHF